MMAADAWCATAISRARDHDPHRPGGGSLPAGTRSHVGQGCGRIAEAIARFLSRYWVDTASGVELIMTHRGANIAYLASRVYPVPILGGHHHQDVRV
jgi:hypothetical protein